jgi:hypothetical protein
LLDPYDLVAMGHEDVAGDHDRLVGGHDLLLPVPVVPVIAVLVVVSMTFALGHGCATGVQQTRGGYDCGSQCKTISRHEDARSNVGMKTISEHAFQG